MSMDTNKNKALTPKQSAFVDYYLANGFNATQAAISAGYSERSAEVEGSRLLSNAKVAKYVNIAKSEIKTRCGYTQDMLVKELEVAQEMARATDNPSAFIKATEVKAKMLGLNEVEKKEVSITQLPAMIIDGSELNL